MNDSEDIRNLFGKFDGQAQQYQEVARDDQATEARSRWPLLSSLAVTDAERLPDVGEGLHSASIAESPTNPVRAASSAAASTPSPLFSRKPAAAPASVVTPATSPRSATPLE